MTAATFEGWACVELFGHRVVYAHVSEVTMFGATFARLDIPSDPPALEFKSASAIYGITPVDEETVRGRHRPRRFDQPQLSGEVVVDDDEDDSWSPDDEDDLPSERDSDAPRSAT